MSIFRTAFNSAIIEGSNKSVWRKMPKVLLLVCDENTERGDCGETAKSMDRSVANSPAIDGPTEVVELGPISLQELQPPTAPTTKPTIDYINNIKIFLTCLVIVFHMANYDGQPDMVGLSLPLPFQIFQDVCLSFFMSLFFSGLDTSVRGR